MKMRLASASAKGSSVMRTTATLTLSALSFVLASSLALAQNLVVNGGFEYPVIPNATYADVPTNQFVPWQTDGTNFEIWSDGMTVDGSQPTYSAQGRQNLEVLGGGSSVWQTISTSPHENYVLSFSYTPRATVHSTMFVYIDSKLVATLDADGTALNTFEWRNFTTNFTSTAAFTTIRFSDIGPGAGTHIDNVSVTQAPAVEHAIYTTIGTQMSYGNDQRTRITTKGFVIFEPDTQRGTAIAGFVRNGAKHFAVVPMQNYRVDHVSGAKGVTYTIVAKAESPGTQFAGTLLEAIYMRGPDSQVSLGSSGQRHLPKKLISSSRSIVQNDQTGIYVASEASGTAMLDLRASVASNLANESFAATVARVTSQFIANGYTQIAPTLGP